jgi:hypothetical protein
MAEAVKTGAPCPRMRCLFDRAATDLHGLSRIFFLLSFVLKNPCESVALNYWE